MRLAFGTETGKREKPCLPFVGLLPAWGQQPMESSKKAERRSDSKPVFGHDISNTHSYTAITEGLFGLKVEDNSSVKPASRKLCSTQGDKMVNELVPSKLDSKLMEWQELSSGNDKCLKIGICDRNADTDASKQQSDLKIKRKSPKGKRDSIPIDTTFNDADDEQDTVSDSENVGNISNDEIGKHVNELKKSSEREYEKFAESLLKKIEVSENEAKESKKLASHYLSELNEVNRLSELNKYNQTHINEIMTTLQNKFDACHKLAASRNDEGIHRLNQIEQMFNTIQKMQANVHQQSINSLKMKLKQREFELQEAKKNYAQLEQWVFILFKEIGERSKTWSNREFMVTTKVIAKVLKPPVKKSDLELIYRYLLQFLYQNGEEEIAESAIQQNSSVDLI